MDSQASFITSGKKQNEWDKMMFLQKGSHLSRMGKGAISDTPRATAANPI